MKIHSLLSIAIFSILTSTAIAQETAAPAPAPAPAPVVETKPATYSELLQKKYSLTEAEMKSLADSKLNNEHQAMATRLARSSGKTIDEVLKLRLEDKLGWGKVAKTLGVHPSELGKAVSEMNKERNAVRKAEMAEKNRIKKEKRDAEKKERDEAKAAKREEKRKDNDNKLRPNDKAKPEHEERGKNK